MTVFFSRIPWDSIEVGRLGLGDGGYAECAQMVMALQNALGKSDPKEFCHNEVRSLAY